MSDKIFKTENVFSIDDLTLAHQFGSNSWGKRFHRIVRLDDDGTVLDFGEHDITDHPAFFTHEENKYMVLTTYFDDDAIKTETIFKLTAAKLVESKSNE